MPRYITLAGADTSKASVQAFFLAMVLFPEVQRRAQAELDKVIGPDRLPLFTDRPFLPYIEAVVRETLRWHLVTPLGVPHYSTEDDEYKGYYIPKGSVVIGNAWAILHNPEDYPDPEEFMPERYLTDDGQLNPNVPDPDIACFGFGRRICPGRYFARDGLFIQIASVLHTFSITPALNEGGIPVTIERAVTSGVASYPMPFQCSITPRSCAAGLLVSD